MLFIVGDRVLCNIHIGGYQRINQRGTIIRSTEDDITVEFDYHIGGHAGKLDTDRIEGKTGHCWHFSSATAIDNLVIESGYTEKICIRTFPDKTRFKNEQIHYLDNDVFIFSGDKRCYKWEK
jgi:hypothetical protein